MSKSIKPSRSIRSPKVTGKISKSELRSAVKKVAENRTDSTDKKTPPHKKR